MKALVDLQILQSNSVNDHAADLALGLAVSLAESRAVEQLIVLLNDAQPAADLLTLRQRIAATVPRAKIFAFTAPWPDSTKFVAKEHELAERVRDQLIAELAVDLVVNPSLFADATKSVVSVAAVHRPLTAVIGILPSQLFLGEAWAAHRATNLRQADLVVYSGGEGQHVLASTIREPKPDELVADPDSDAIVAVVIGWYVARQLSVDRARTTLPRVASLAFMTPWPPQSSGIANHAHRIAGELAYFYEVTLVLSDAVAATAAKSEGWRVISPAQFAPERFDRVLVQLGNNALFHADAVKFLAKARGFVIAHETSFLEMLGDLNAVPGAQGLRYLQDGVLGLTDATLPVGAELLRESIGVATHSHAGAQSLVGLPRYPLPSALVHEVPLVLLRDIGDRASARALLGVGETELLVASFGRVAPHKGVDTFLRACRSLHQKGLCFRVAVVGPHSDPDYVERLESLGVPAVFTGEVSEDEYGCWLAATDVAVQLRPGFRGETSGALIEAMAAGCAVIAEDVGSLGELARGRGILVAAPATEEAVAAALAELVSSPEVRQELGKRAAIEVMAEHSPAAVANRLVGAIEAAYRRFGVPTQRQLADPAAIAAWRRNWHAQMAPRFLMDVTSLYSRQVRAGARRVTECLLVELASISRLAIFPVRHDGREFVHAAEVAAGLLQLPSEPSLLNRSVWPKSGDIFLSSGQRPPGMSWIESVRLAQASGCRYVQFMPDLLPLSMPEFFAENVGSGFGQWVQTILDSADLVLCGSEAVRDEFKELVEQPVIPARQDRRVPVATIRMGSTVPVGRYYSPELRRRGRGCSNVMFVGDAGPRSGLDALLRALHVLWADGEDVHCVVVGQRAGDADLLAQLAQLDEGETRFTWLPDADDFDLAEQYLHADVLVMARRGEGLGLPVLEAVAHGVPVVARDLPVIREILGEQVDYFELDCDLPEVIRRRLALGAPPTCLPKKVITWREAAVDLLAAIDKDLVTNPLADSGFFHDEPEDQEN